MRENKCLHSISQGINHELNKIRSTTTPCRSPAHRSTCDARKLVHRTPVITEAITSSHSTSPHITPPSRLNATWFSHFLRSCDENYRSCLLLSSTQFLLYEAFCYYSRGLTRGNPGTLATRGYRQFPQRNATQSSSKRSATRSTSTHTNTSL